MPPVSPSTVADASSSLIKDTALGAFALICLALAVWAILQLKKVQDARVDDKEKAADRQEKANAEDRKAQGEVAKALSELASAQSESAKAMDRLTRAVEDNTRAQNDIVRDAVRVVRRSSGSSGSMVAVQTPPRPSLRREE